MHQDLEKVIGMAKDFAIVTMLVAIFVYVAKSADINP